jgi:hypothetical protein
MWLRDLPMRHSDSQSQNLRISLLPLFQLVILTLSEVEGEESPHFAFASR